MEYTAPITDWVNLGCFNHSSGSKYYRANYDMLEIITYSSTLTSGEITEVLDYLNNKHTVY